jgi:hypothetical protein
MVVKPLQPTKETVGERSNSLGKETSFSQAAKKPCSAAHSNYYYTMSMNCLVSCIFGGGSTYICWGLGLCTTA